MSEKVHSPVYNIKTNSPEELPLAILKAYRDDNKANYWYPNVDLSETSGEFIAKANKRIDDENEALGKAIEKLESNDSSELQKEVDELKATLNDKNHVIFALGHLFIKYMEIDDDEEIYAEVLEMSDSSSLQNSVGISWIVPSLSTYDLKKLMKFNPVCCKDAEDGKPKVELNVYSNYIDENNEEQLYNGKFEVVISVQFSENDWKSINLK